MRLLPSLAGTGDDVRALFPCALVVRRERGALGDWHCLPATRPAAVDDGHAAGTARVSTWTFAVPEPINLRQMLLAACGCSPFFLTILGATALYAIALLRRVAHAFHWLTVAVALLVMVGPTTGSFHGPLCLHAWPLALLAAIQFFAAIRYRSGLNALLTAVCAIAALCIAWPDAIWARWFGAIPAHLFLFAMLLIGALIRDRMSRFLQVVAIRECSSLAASSSRARPTAGRSPPRSC